MTIDDWIVQIDDFLLANHAKLTDFLKVTDFRGIRYIEEPELRKFFKEVKITEGIQDDLIKEMLIPDIDGKQNVLSF